MSRISNGAAATARHAATRMAVTISFVVLVVTASVAPGASASTSGEPPTDRTALIMGGTSVPRWHDADIEVIVNQFIKPTHANETITPVAVTIPGELWPLTGLGRLIGLAVGDPRIFGPGGAAWPDEPWWKLSGLFDLTGGQSLQAGVADLEAAMAQHGDSPLVIYGYSQGAGVANVEKRKLAEQYPKGTPAPDIDFVLGGDPNLPNGGLLARFPGLYIPILDFPFNGPAATDTQFETVEIVRQYDGFTDFPLYPLNLIADLNAVLGIAYVHLHPFDVSLPPAPADPNKSPAFQGTYGDTSYYFFENPDLPLFGPLRTLGVPEPLIDVVEPFFRVLVELGYDRSIPLWEPTPARLIPTPTPSKVTADLVNAVGEGVENAMALVGGKTVAPTDRTPAIRTARADIAPQNTSTEVMNQADRTAPTGSTSRTRQTEPTNTPSRTDRVAPTDAISRTDPSAPAEAVSPVSEVARTDTDSGTSLTTIAEQTDQTARTASTNHIPPLRLKRTTKRTAPTTAANQTDQAAPTDNAGQTEGRTSTGTSRHTRERTITGESSSAAPSSAAS